jgi:hypothetical protein
VAKVLVSDVMATHHDRRTAWPDRQSRQRPRAVRITSHRAVLPPYLRPRPILAQYRINRKSVLDGPTDEYHIATCPPRTATERRGQHPSRIFEPHSVRSPQTNGVIERFFGTLKYEHLYQARRGAPLRHGALRGHCPGSAVGLGCEGPHRRAGAAGPARPHYRPARRDGADSLGWPSSPDCRASSACPAHAALLIEERGVLLAGDMLSDVLIPMLDLNDTADPIEDYLAALRLLEGVAGDVDVLVPGHGSIGGADQVHARIDQDRAYVHALRDAHVPSDPRVGPSATYGKDWLPGVHARQLQHLARTSERDGTPG